MNLPLAIVVSFIILISSAGWAQQPPVASAQQMTSQAGLAPGRYLGMIFGWQTTVTVVSTDVDGQIHGSLTSCPNEIRRQYGLQCATVEFNTQRGEDGLPEHIAPRPISNDSSATNDYTGIRACGDDLCIHVSRMIGREDGTGDEKVDVNVTLVKQATEAAPTTEQFPSVTPSGLASPGMPPMPSGTPLTQMGRPPLAPPGFAPPKMSPMPPGVSSTHPGSPPLSGSFPLVHAPQTVTPLPPK
jgi:hypothetical protein